VVVAVALLCAGLVYKFSLHNGKDIRQCSSIDDVDAKADCIIHDIAAKHARHAHHHKESAVPSKDISQCATGDANSKMDCVFDVVSSYQQYHKSRHHKHSEKTGEKPKEDQPMPEGKQVETEKNAEDEKRSAEKEKKAEKESGKSHSVMECKTEGTLSEQQDCLIEAIARHRQHHHRPCCMWRKLREHSPALCVAVLLFVAGFCLGKRRGRMQAAAETASGYQVQDEMETPVKA